MTRANEAYRFGDTGPGSYARAAERRREATGYNTPVCGTPGYQAMVAHATGQQSQINSYLGEIHQHQHDTNMRVLESTALIAGAVVAWNHLGQHDGRQHQTYSRDGGQTYFVPGPSKERRNAVICLLLLAAIVGFFYLIGNSGQTGSAGDCGSSTSSYNTPANCGVNG